MIYQCCGPSFVSTAAKLPVTSVIVDMNILQVMCNHSRKDAFICFQLNEKIYISLASMNDNTWNSTEMIAVWHSSHLYVYHS